MIRRISQEYERSCPNDVESDTMTHAMRMKAVDELLRSHTYAAEMRRAAKSASTWLRSIWWSDASTDEADENTTKPAVLKRRGKSAGVVEENKGGDEQGSDQAAGEDQESGQKNANKMESVALKGLLRSAELKATEREELAIRLNEELSECRAGIGRWKTAARAEVSVASVPCLHSCDYLSHSFHSFFRISTSFDTINDEDSTSSAAASKANNSGSKVLYDVGRALAKRCVR